MKEMVKKKKMKLLDDGFVCLILYSEWMSLVQVVPKNVGIAMVNYDSN